MPWGNGAESPAICDRCGLKRGYQDLRHEPASGLYVCDTCFDGPGLVQRFVWRSRGYPLRHARPDVPLDMPVGASWPQQAPEEGPYSLPVNEEG